MPSAFTSKVLVFAGSIFWFWGYSHSLDRFSHSCFRPALLEIVPYISAFVSLVSLATLLIGVAGWASRQPNRRLLRFGLVFIGLAGGCVFLVGRVYNGVDNIIGLLLLASAATFILIDLAFLVVGIIYGSRS